MSIDDLAGLIGDCDIFDIDTEEKAEEYIKSSANMSAMVEELAFRQVVINVLLVSGLVNENDFNAACEHFKNEFRKEFAKRLLAEAEEWRKVRDNFSSDDDFDDGEADEFLEPGKKLHQA